MGPAAEGSDPLGLVAFGVSLEPETGVAPAGEGDEPVDAGNALLRAAGGT